MKEIDLVAKISSELDNCFEEHSDYPTLKEKNRLSLILALVLSILIALVIGLLLLSLIAAVVFLLFYGIYTLLGWSGVRGIVICLLFGAIPGRELIGKSFKRIWTISESSFKSSYKWIRRLVVNYFGNKYIDKYEKQLLLSHTKAEVNIFRKKHISRRLMDDSDDELIEKIEDMFDLPRY